MTATLIAPAAVAARRVRPGLVLATVLAGQFMAILDVSIVNVAAPTIKDDLHASGSGLQLVIAGYAVAYAMLLITGARLGDLYGSRRVFTAGLAVFTLASLACGLAGDTSMLIAARLVQGAGAALVMPQVLGVIQRHFEGPARTRALGLYAAVLAGGSLVGQVLGGALVQADLFGAAWRPIFLVNVPVGAVLLVAAVRLLPAAVAGAGSRRLDLLGVLTLSPAVVLLVVPLVLGHELGWPAWGWLSMLASVVVFAVFAVVQRRVADPLMPPRLLRHPGVTVAAVGIFALMAGYGGFLFTVALHLQYGLGFSPLQAGVAFIPGALGFALTSLNWRRVPAARQHVMMPAAMLLAGAGYAALGPATQAGLFWYEAALAAVGLGLGAAFSPMISFGLRHVPPAEAGDAAGLLSTMTQLGSVVGVAAFGTLYLTRVQAHPSADAVAVTGLALAAAAVLTAGCALRLNSHR